LDSEASHLYVIVKVIMVPAVLAMPDQVAPPMTAPADLLTAAQVALVMQGQVDPLMMVPVVQHIAVRVDQCHVHLVDELMMDLAGQHTADRAAHATQGQVGHAIQVLAELGGRARQFVDNYASDGIEFSDAVFDLKPSN
jgi:hypothetical protein